MNGACTAEITGLDEIAARISMHPLKARTEAAMADDVLDYATQLPKNSLEFARLRAKLRALGVTLTDWNQAVQQRQTQRKRTSVPPPAPKEAEERPKIVINKLEEFEVNEAAVEALARLPYLYQRFGLLTRVLDIKRPVPGRKDEKETALEIRTISPPFLRELFTRAASWHEEQLDPATGEPVLVRAHPPEWSVKAVYNWQSWPHIRPLHHISEIPVLLSDGTLLSTPGYDAATGILYEPRVEVPPIPDLPTEQDIDAAKLKLLDIVDEFPFEKEVHRSAFFAALLTPIARWAFEGQSPLFMFDANQAGSGKGLLTRVIGLLALGHQMDLITSTSNEEEERKRITAKLLSGATMVLIDNIGSMFGSQVLEALLTTSVWSERLLGSNDAPRLDAWITWYGSGNNVQYAREDTRRRVCTIRVVTNLERPEERDDYKYRDLEGHVKAHRGELLAAALTILRGWLRTGKKASELSGWGGPWGSYDGWDQVVRGAIVYAGLPDPIAAKATKDGGSAKDAGLRDLVEGLEEAAAQLGPTGVAAAQIIEALNENDEWRRADKRSPIRFKKLRNAFSTMTKLPPGQLPNANQLGSLFGRYKANPVNNKWILSRTLEGENLWYVGKVPDPKDIEREAIVAEANGVRSVIGPNGRCELCGTYAHKACGRCPHCLPEFGGCPCRECLRGDVGNYTQTGACNLCGKHRCRCSRCGDCQNIGPSDGGCAC